MTTLSLTDPVNGTVADANTIASNNTAIKNVVNGNIDNANVATAAAVAVSKLAAGASGQVLGMLAGVPTWLGGLGQIADSTLGSSAASIDLTSLPTTYAHMLIVGYFRGDTAATDTPVNFRLNNDSGANYYTEEVAAAGATLTGGENIAATSASFGSCPANTGTANRFSADIIFIPHYTQTTNHKSFIGFSSEVRLNTGGNTILRVSGGAWAATAAVSRLTVLPGAGNFVTGSRLTVYGIG